MDSIVLSEFVATNFTLKNTVNLEIVVDIELSTIESANFTNCVFKFAQNGKLRFSSTIFEDCIFEGIKIRNDIKNRQPELHFSSCTLKKIKLQNFIKYFVIINSSIENLNDVSTTVQSTISSCSVINSNIYGITDELRYHKSTFESFGKGVSDFNKIILKSAVCKEVTFGNIKLNPFYLATKCHDKSSLDLTRATLTDDWSKLRKKYSGMGLIVVITLTIFFFVPYLSRSLLLLMLHKIDVQKNIFDTVPLWKVLFYGKYQGIAALLYCGLTILLLTYNILRLCVTLYIAKLREEERFLKDANFQLVSIHPQKLHRILKIDGLLDFLFYISVIYFLFKLGETLWIDVPALI